MAFKTISIRAYAMELTRILHFRYVADRSDELFPEGAYVDASEAMGSIKQLSVKR